MIIITNRLPNVLPYSAIDPDTVCEVPYQRHVLLEADVRPPLMPEVTAIVDIVPRAVLHQVAVLAAVGEIGAKAADDVRVELAGADGVVEEGGAVVARALLVGALHVQRVSKDFGPGAEEHEFGDDARDLHLRRVEDRGHVGLGVRGRVAAMRPHSFLLHVWHRYFHRVGVVVDGSEVAGVAVSLGVDPGWREHVGSRQSSAERGAQALEYQWFHVVVSAASHTADGMCVSEGLG